MVLPRRAATFRGDPCRVASAGRCRWPPHWRCPRHLHSHRSCCSRAARCGRWRCRPTARSCSPSNTPGQPAGDLRRRRRRPDQDRLGAGRHGAGRRRGAHQQRGLGRQPPLRQRQHRRRQRHPPRVVRTLLVGDEPRDIVFAGPGGNRAFITTARRGQNVPAIGAAAAHHRRARRARWSGCSTRPTSAARSTARRSTIIELFGDTPRALAVSPDGSTVYAAVFHSGNQTRRSREGAVCDDSNLNNNTVRRARARIVGVTMPGRPADARNSNVERRSPRPETGLIVKFNQRRQPVARSSSSRNWNNAVRFNLPDLDVFTIDANANPPAQIGLDAAQYAHVGTVLFNMVVNPANDKVYVSNTDAQNEVRFEGPGILGGSDACAATCTRRASRCSTAPTCCRAISTSTSTTAVGAEPAGTATTSLATPVGMAVSSDGTTLYVAALRLEKIGVFDTAKLENDTFTRAAATACSTSRSAAAGRAAWCSTRPTTASTCSPASTTRSRSSTPPRRPRRSAHKQPLYNPEPAERRRRPAVPLRRGLHLQQRRGVVLELPHLRRLRQPRLGPRQPGRHRRRPIRTRSASTRSCDPDFHPMKGPMTTQSLRGMANHGPMHWRGDRTGG